MGIEPSVSPIRPHGHTQDEATVVLTGGPLGADVRGVDLSSSLSDELFSFIGRSLVDHLVLRFRGQRLSDPQLIRLGRRFGKIRNPRMREYDGSGVLSEIEVISNIVQNGRPIGALGAGEATWHTDLSMFEIPASVTMLYSLELPPCGGNTRFANMYLAYEALPDDLKERVNGRTSIHDISYTAAGAVRQGFKTVEDKSKAPGAVHPIVRTHPISGRKALYLGRQGYGYISGLSVAESDALLDEIWNHMVRPEFSWEHEWQLGDLVIWDNRSTIHGRGSFDASARRILHRIVVEGERPV
jgi:taurine dioxygenase